MTCRKGIGRWHTAYQKPKSIFLSFLSLGRVLIFVSKQLNPR